MKNPTSNNFLFVNLACGNSYVEAPERVNLDYSTLSPAVQRADILGALPFED